MVTWLPLSICYINNITIKHFIKAFFIVAQMKMKGHSGHTCNPLNHVCNTQNNVVVTYILNVKILQLGYWTSVLRILQLMWMGDLSNYLRLFLVDLAFPFLPSIRCSPSLRLYGVTFQGKTLLTSSLMQARRLAEVDLRSAYPFVLQYWISSLIAGLQVGLLDLTGRTI